MLVSHELWASPEFPIGHLILLHRGPIRGPVVEKEIQQLFISDGNSLCGHQNLHKHPSQCGNTTHMLCMQIPKLSQGFLKKCFQRPNIYNLSVSYQVSQIIYLISCVCFLKSFAYEVRGWCMMAALVKLMLTSSCLLYVKQNRGIEGRTQKDETSQIRGMKGTLVGKIWSPRPTSAEQFWYEKLVDVKFKLLGHPGIKSVYSPGIWNRYSLFKSFF